MPDRVGEERGLRRGAVGVAAREGRLLVIRRSQWVEAPGAWCFPGGAIEPGESEEAALIREFREELDVLVCPVRRLWRCVTSWSVALAWWLVEPAPGALFALHPREVDALLWLTPAEIRRLPHLLESNRQFLDAASSGAFEVQQVDFSR
jgi:8-oxo-dGTP diphosphatase